MQLKLLRRAKPKLTIAVYLQIADYVKWLTTAVQLVGYDSTGTGITLWKLYLFFASIPLCFEVGVIWL